MIDNDFYIATDRTTPLQPIPLPVTSGFPLNYARIGYDNILINGLATADSDSIGVQNLLSPATYDRWRPVISPATATITASSLSLCDYVGIAAHNLNGLAVVVTVSDGVTPLEIYNGTPSTDNAIYIRFTQGGYDRVIIEVTNAGLNTEIGVCYLGLELEMMRPIYSGHTPVLLSSEDKFTPQMSDGGQFLGKQIVRQGYSTSADFKHLEGDWYRANFQPFVESAKVRPYFWCWNLLEHSDDVVYGWTNGNIKPSLMGIRNWFEVSFDIIGHA